MPADPLGFRVAGGGPTYRLVVLVLLLAARAGATVVTAPGYLARTIATPDPVQGGVVRQGTRLIVGQGAAGARRSEETRKTPPPRAPAATDPRPGTRLDSHRSGPP